MYKVFFNDHILRFHARNNISSKYNKDQVIEIESLDELLMHFPDWGFMKRADSLDVICSDPEEVWKSLRASLIEIPAAGGLLCNMNSEILFIKRLGRWDLPKGKIEKGESIEQAAVREVEEECGLTNPRIRKQLPSTFHLYNSPYIRTGNNLVLKETFWFEMIYNGTEKPNPQVSEDITEVKWFSKNDLEEVFSSTYNNLIELLENYLD